MKEKLYLILLIILLPIILSGCGSSHKTSSTDNYYTNYSICENDLSQCTGDKTTLQLESNSWRDKYNTACGAFKQLNETCTQDKIILKNEADTCKTNYWQCNNDLIQTKQKLSDLKTITFWAIIVYIILNVAWILLGKSISDQEINPWVSIIIFAVLLIIGLIIAATQNVVVF
jgi:hypothetical protein